MSAAIELVLDCADAEQLARFWTAALGYRRLGAAGNYVALVPDPDDGRPKLILQRVDEPKAAKNRMHLDMLAADIEAEAGRLVALGARRQTDAPVEEHSTRWIRMTDPEGNEFCVCQG
jgi:predicted enzyme related to lactoylglutathione lyase